MNKKVKVRYSDHVYFGEICGPVDVILFKEMAGYIIKNKKNKMKQNMTLLQQQLK